MERRWSHSRTSSKVRPSSTTGQIHLAGNLSRLGNKHRTCASILRRHRAIKLAPIDAKCMQTSVCLTTTGHTPSTRPRLSERTARTESRRRGHCTRQTCDWWPKCAQTVTSKGDNSRRVPVSASSVPCSRAVRIATQFTLVPAWTGARPSLLNQNASRAMATL